MDIIKTVISRVDILHIVAKGRTILAGNRVDRDSDRKPVRAFC